MALSSVQKKNYYDSIDDLPCYNYDKLIQTGDLSWLIIDGEVEDNILVEVWYNMQIEIIDRFGVSDSMINLLNKEAELCLLYKQLLIDGNKKVSAMIKIKEFELEEMKEMVSSDKSDASIYAIISKYLGFNIKKKETTIGELYEFIQNYKKDLKDGRG